jgi:hypothetical protein
MDLDKIFNIIEEDPIDEDLSYFQSSPYYKISMFVKILINGLTFQNQIVSMFERSDKNLDPQNIKNAGEFLLHTRAWYWISQFELDNDKWIKTLKSFKNDDLHLLLQKQISYFESQEEYEKCSFLLKIQKHLEE